MRLLMLLPLLLLTACEPKKADPRYEVGEKTVKDKNTGLTWERFPSPNTMPMATGQEYCANLSLDGFSGFRLPTKSELLGITRRVRAYEALAHKAAIDRVAFPKTETSNYWATIDPDNAQPRVKGWAVDFSDGTHNNLVTPGDGFYIRCVR